MKANSLTRPDITAVIASTGGGKTWHIKSRVLKPAPRRLLIWDFPFAEYADFAEYVSFGDLARRLHGTGKASSYALAVTGSIDNAIRAKQFDAWCRLVMAAASASGGLVAVVEELKDVTTASRAPVPWNILVRTGRKVGVRLLATSQRPTQIDKDFLAQCTTIHCGPVGYDDDCIRMAKELRTTVEAVRALRPGQFLEYSRETGATAAGALDMARPKRRRST